MEKGFAGEIERGVFRCAVLPFALTDGRRVGVGLHEAANRRGGARVLAGAVHILTAFLAAERGRRGWVSAQRTHDGARFVESVEADSAFALGVGVEVGELIESGAWTFGHGISLLRDGQRSRWPMGGAFRSASRRTEERSCSKAASPSWSSFAGRRRSAFSRARMTSRSEWRRTFSQARMM